MTRMRALYSQLDPMRQMVSKLKKESKDAMKKIAALEKDMDGIIHKIQVWWMIPGDMFYIVLQQ